MQEKVVEIIDLAGKSPHGDVGRAGPICFNQLKGQVIGFIDDQEGRRLFRLILGQGDIHAGRISLFDQQFERQPDRNYQDDRAVLQKIGFGFRDKGLISNRTIFENVDLPARYHGYYQGDIKEGSLAEKCLEELKVPKEHWNSRPPSVNWEVRKRALLARATVLQPKLLLLDDPSCLLDTKVIPEIINWIQLKKSQGVSIIVSSVNIPFTVAVSDFVVNPSTNRLHADAVEFVENTWIESANLLKEFSGRAA
jgi:ABC-type ATPase involved in cell division